MAYNELAVLDLSLNELNANKRGYTEREYECFIKINEVARQLAARECYDYPERFDFRRGVYIEKYNNSGEYWAINADEERWFGQACNVIELLYKSSGDFVDSIPIETPNVYFSCNEMKKAHKECLKYRKDLTAHHYYRGLYTNSMDSMLRDLTLYGLLSENTISVISNNLIESSAVKII
ncbi:hypothetical protein FH968_19790 [Buttiauxella sp. B2]|uniref:hypothetical protein n=1 Tax=Buttiauxella sp. B2 TaxID=2587812 RepID=UPI00112329FB|nr:hypothetical protein [Buttiauxella sp. B2]TNV16087.1 hypothetical protein FH968_19790 [Buttiauxella sp. B2]